MKHTPGPWHYSPTDKLNPSRAYGINRDIEVEGDEGMWPSTETIAEVCTGETAEADARLIAAAPDLAAVLRACASLRKRWQDDDDFGTVDYVDALGDLHPEIAAALAKLEGGAS